MLSAGQGHPAGEHAKERQREDARSAHLSVLRSFGQRNLQMIRRDIRSRRIRDFTHGQTTLFLFLISSRFAVGLPWRVFRGAKCFCETRRYLRKPSGRSTRIIESFYRRQQRKQRLLFMFHTKPCSLSPFLSVNLSFCRGRRESDARTHRTPKRCARKPRSRRNYDQAGVSDPGCN
jgi:hypothetical protein